MILHSTSTDKRPSYPILDWVIPQLTVLASSDCAQIKAVSYNVSNYNDKPIVYFKNRRENASEDRLIVVCDQSENQ